MKVRFCTSLADGPFSYMEGTILELPDPMPAKFLGWLRGGIVEAMKDAESEVALEPAAVEHAIARRSRRLHRGRKRAKQSLSVDGDYP